MERQDVDRRRFLTSLAAGGIVAAKCDGGGRYPAEELKKDALEYPHLLTGQLNNTIGNKGLYEILFI